jgi:N-succinyldiaminopimelate aminotransferase
MEGWSPAARVQGLGTSVFTEMTELAKSTGSVNLGQGVPDLDSPSALLRYATEAVLAGHNQYPPALGLPALREAVVADRLRCFGVEYRAQDEILITTGATEAIASALLALCGPGDEIIVFDPCYDSYPAVAKLAGARLVGVPLATDGDGFGLDVDALRAAITPHTRVLLLNSPHNPTGKVFTADELAAIAALCVEHSLTVVTDEVYEHLVYDGAQHLPLASLPGMRERTLTISSAGKTFNVTGWKIGWIMGPAPLVSAVGAAKQFLTYASGTPFQEALSRVIGDSEQWAADLRDTLSRHRDLLTDGLRQAGLHPYRAEGGYFVQADVRPWGYSDGWDFCRQLPERAGVVAIPTSAFYVADDAPTWLVRFSFCRREDQVRAAVEKLVKAR